jgi:hypothetical protein
MNSNSQQQAATASNSSNRLTYNSNSKNYILYRILISYIFVADVAGVSD